MLHELYQLQLLYFSVYVHPYYMSQVKGQVIRQRQDRKCPWAAILITKISVADNRLGISTDLYICEGAHNKDDSSCG